VLAFKRKNADRSVRATRAPSETTIKNLSRALWEFGEQVRIESLNRQERTRRLRT
jgi:hypothetical protein